MHSSVQIQMNRKLDLMVSRVAAEVSKKLGTENDWLELVFPEQIKGFFDGVEYHDRQPNALLSQGDSLVRKGNGQVIRSHRLKVIGNLGSAAAVGKCLDHDHHLGFGIYLPLIKIEVMGKRIQVDLQRRSVNPLLQPIDHPLEGERSRTSDQDEIILK